MILKISKILICLFIFCNQLAADDAPLAMIPGGNVIPINNNDIQLYSETIDISLYPGYYTVEVNYTFINRGESQTVNMGFPSNKETKVLDFKSFENGKIVKTQTKPGNWEFKLSSDGVGAQFYENPINAFECFIISFNKGETKHIKNTYRQYYTDSYGGGRVSFFYILKTGSLWKNKIHSVDIRVNTKFAPEGFVLSKGIFNDEKASLMNFTKKYTDLEPEHDLFFTIELKMDFSVTKASSELPSTNGNSYCAANVSDRDASTAWIEGIEGYGIGETIGFYTNRGHNQGETLQLDSIAIINGYAKNQAVFKDNSRVKQFKIISSTDNDYDKEYGKVRVTIVNLKDTSIIQYFKFKTPINATDMEFKISDVYKGLKYKDTAISEIVFFLAGNE